PLRDCSMAAAMRSSRVSVPSSSGARKRCKGANWNAEWRRVTARSLASASIAANGQILGRSASLTAQTTGSVETAEIGEGAGRRPPRRQASHRRRRAAVADDEFSVLDAEAKGVAVLVGDFEVEGRDGVQRAQLRRRRRRPPGVDQQRLAKRTAGEDVDVGLGLQAIAAGQRAYRLGALGREICLVVGDRHALAEIGEAVAGGAGGEIGEGFGRVRLLENLVREIGVAAGGHALRFVAPELAIAALVAALRCQQAV